MSRQVALHNPALMSDEELEATFVAREVLLQDVLSGLRERAGKPVNQSLLIVGPRGIGKTNFLHMIRARLLADDDLRRAYQPLLFPEETYAITSARDLFCEILRALVEETHSEAASEALERVKDDTDDERARETAIEALRDFHAATGRKALVMLENLDLLLGDQITDQTDVSRLRDVLMNEGFLFLIATSPTHFRQVNGYDQPLYEFLRLIDLGELAGAQAEELLRRRAEFEGNADFLSRFDEYARRLPAIRHLTGGNPRLILMLYTVFCQTALVEVRGALQALLDDLTPYYKARIERLSPQQRKVLDAFAREGKPLTPTEIARSSNLPPAQVSTVLSRLEEAGFVELAEQKRRRRRLYVVSERMFRIWHQMRTSPAGRRRMTYLIEFISLWYSAAEARLESERLLTTMRDDFGHGQHQAAAEKAEYLGYLVAGVADLGAALGIGEEAIGECIGSGHYGEAEGLVEQAVGRARREGRPKDVAWAEFWRALLCQAQGRYHLAIEALTACVCADPRHWAAHALWGEALRRSAASDAGHRGRELLEEACWRIEESLRLAPETESQLLGLYALTLVDLADRSTGEEARAGLLAACAKFEEALRAGPGDARTYHGWGVALLKLAVLSSREGALSLAAEACANLEQAARLDPSNAWVHFHWAVALHGTAVRTEGAGTQAILEQACGKYARAVETDSGHRQAWYDWSLALERWAELEAPPGATRLVEDAVEKARKALELAGGADAANIGDYRARLANALTGQARMHLAGGNLGSAQTALREAVGPDLLGPDERREVVVSLAKEFLEETTADFFWQVLADLREQGLGEDAEALAPIEAAVEYWQREGDEAVLERLNPEVREITEEIVRRGERAEGEGGKTD
jgi:DNA-binding MarR family transcriptional regulator